MHTVYIGLMHYAFSLIDGHPCKVYSPAKPVQWDPSLSQALSAPSRAFPLKLSWTGSVTQIRGAIVVNLGRDACVTRRRRLELSPCNTEKAE